MLVISFHAKCYSFKTTQPTTPQEMRTLFKMKTLDLTFQESGDNTVDVEFVRLSHLPALPEDLVLHEVPLLSDWVLIHKQSLSVELELSLLCDLS